MNLPSQARFIAVLMLALATSAASGHEGHQPLPTKGVQVDTQNGQLTLSAQARNAIGLQAEELLVGTVASTLTVYAEAVTPWQAKAFGSAQISGRIAKLLSRPGDFVKKDQIIAELSSRELELLKLDYQQAVNDVSLNQRLLDMTRPTALAGAVPMQRLLEIENAVEQSQNSRPYSWRFFRCLPKQRIWFVELSHSVAYRWPDPSLGPGRGQVRGGVGTPI